jgi:hypothetical protein
MKFKATKSMSAAELMGRLGSNPDWVRRNAEREAQRETAATRMREKMMPEESPIVAELSSIGINVSSVWELVNAKWSYPAAIPILTTYLQQVHHPVLREGIARALTVPEAKGISGHVIVNELRQAESHKIRWVLANALTVVADASLMETLKALISDNRYADVRERLKVAVENIAAT